jgi:hypothetical protein
MRLEKASHKAIKYACMNFHYAKRIPVNCIGYSVFNTKKEWCGVVVFGAGIMGIEKPYFLQKGEVYELVRVALNGKQDITSKAVSIAIKKFSKEAPLVKLLISYADSDQNHKGVIYQAMNWYYTGSKITCCRWIDKSGKEIHDRRVDKKGYKIEFGKKVKCKKPDELTKIETGVKHKYIYPLDKSLLPLCKSFAKPYPKAQEVNQDKRDASSIEIGGSNPTLALTKQKQIAAV